MTNYKSYIYQSISIIFSFFNVRLMLNFLGDLDYANWILVFSVAGIIYSFDFGVGNSVRNQLARSIAKKSKVQMKSILIFRYYKLISILAVSLCALTIFFGLLAFSFGWFQKITIDVYIIVSIMIFMDLITRAHHPIFAGLQSPQTTNLSIAISQMLVTIVLFAFLIPNAEEMTDKLLIASILVFGSSVLVNGLMFVRLNKLIPIQYVISGKGVNKYLHSQTTYKMICRGLPFFIVQIQFSLLGQLPIYYIYKFFDARQVLEVSIAEKIFSPIIIVATVVMYPFWSSYTVMMRRGELSRVHGLIVRQEIIFLVIFIFGLAGCGLFYEEIIRIWLGREVESLIYAYFAILKISSVSFNSIYSYYMNGMGKLRPQMYCYGIGLLLGLPIMYFGSISNNIYICLSVAPFVLFFTGLIQRYQIFNKDLKKLRMA